MPASELNADSTVCNACAGADSYLPSLYEESQRGRCAICGDRTRVLTISHLADEVGEAYEKYAVPADGRLVIEGDNGYEAPDGQTPVENITEILETDYPDLAEAILSVLTDDWAYMRSVQKGGDDLYAADSQDYVLRLPENDTYLDAWASFCRTIKHEARFLNSQAEALLDALFGRVLARPVNAAGSPIITVGASSDAIQSVFRARAANTDAELREILANPAAHLAPPPPILRAPGRMNAQGIRAFYGSVDSETAVAEARTPVGGRAVVGHFDLLEELVCLDLRFVDQLELGMSYLDPEVEDKSSYAAFLRQLHDLIAAPVLPGSEPLEYLPTQMLSEYLQARNISGILFKSALVGGASDNEVGGNAAWNIALFKNASYVENEDMPARRRVTRMHIFGDDDDEEPTSYHLYVQMLENSVSAVGEALNGADSTLPCLRLREGDIRIISVKGIRYVTQSFDIDIENDTVDDDLPF